jgi:hypothetical protein
VFPQFIVSFFTQAILIRLDLSCPV